MQTALERGTSIVTAEPRQAFALCSAWGEHQHRLGRRAWPTPDVLPLSAWLTRSWSRALGSETGSDLPLLLNAAQQRTLWDQILRASARARDLLHPHGAARAAMASWQRVHEWDIGVSALEAAASEETRAFLAWSAQAQQRMREHRWIDRPRALWRCPITAMEPEERELMLLGFDLESPAQRELVRRLAARGAQVERIQSREALAKVAKLACADFDSELHAAARWARRRLERNPAERLLIAIPNLEQRRGQVERVLADVLDPGSLLVSAPLQAATFACEASMPLDTYPIVAAALTALELAARRLTFDTVSHWLRSPYLLAGSSQAPQRARIDIAVRRVAAAELDLRMLVTALVSSRITEADHALLGCLRRLAEQLEHPARMPSEWSATFSAALTVLGWPGDRPLASAEFQTVEKFHAALAELATLDSLVGRVELDAAVRLFRELLEHTPFQPETGVPPVTVTSGMPHPVILYDGIWVSGLHAGAWPEAPRPDPFIPWPAQIEAGLPDASPAGVLERARRALAVWTASSPELIVSWPRRLDGEDCDPSPLLAPLPPASAELAATTPSYAQIIHASARLERRVDETAPPLPHSARPLGGARTLKLQSLCPFRAFAEQRLGARPLEQPEPGIDARTRGSLIHRALQQVWSSLGTAEALRNCAPQEREALIEAAVRSARREVLEARQRWSAGILDIETDRLRSLLRAWLGVEAGRAPFRVMALEQRLECSIGGVQFRVRVDRLDELADGRRLLIDYKSGQAGADEWLGGRPDDPQMPFYALALEPQPAALAYAVLRADGCRFEGLSAVPAAVAELVPVADWPLQLRAWREVIERLTSEFGAGRAEVDPKPTACASCHLHTLCRIDELVAAAERGDRDG